MDIPGIRDLRLLAQQPVALLPGRGVDISSQKTHFLELTFLDKSVTNIPITASAHDTILERLRQQGVPVQQRVSARGSVALPNILGVATQESFLPLDHQLSPGTVEKALREAAAAGDSTPTSRTIPATPLALEAEGETVSDKEDP
jgi:hypothetical protein